MKDRRNGKQRIRVGGDGGWRGERENMNEKKSR